MSWFKRFVAYYKNNPEGYWFKRKLYGWGWMPVRWQGWLVLLGFVALVVLNFYRIDSASHSVSDTLRPFLLETIILVFVLIVVCIKTGEKPRWMWGPPEEESCE